METRGQRIKRIREEKGLSQRNVADHLNVDPMSVSRWERDETTPRDGTRAGLAALLGISVAVMEGYVEASPEHFTLQDLAREFVSALQGAKSENTGRWAERRLRHLPVDQDRRGVSV